MKRRIAATAIMIFGSFVAVLVTGLVVEAQVNRNTDHSADQSLKSNARINPSTLAMELSIPIGGFAGRAGNGMPVSFNYSSKVWQMHYLNSWEGTNGAVSDTKPKYASRTAAGWTSSLGTPRIEYDFDMYAPFVDQVTSYDGVIHTPYFGLGSSPNISLYYVKRVQVVMPDGSSHEFRKDDSLHNYGTSDYPGGTGLPDQAGTFLSVDGSRMRLELAPNASTLFLPNGSRYFFGEKSAEHFAHTYIDQHGNKMTYDRANRRWTDTMGRVLNDPMPMNWVDFYQSQSVGDQVAIFPSFSGEDMEVTFSWRYLKAPSGGESGLEDTSQTLHNLSNVGCQGSATHAISGPYLFGGDSSYARVCHPITFNGMNWTAGPPFNPVVLTKVTLPNGQSYELKYNVYGEIIKIVYPTGAYERFSYTSFYGVQPADSPYDQANRGVSSRWVSERGDGSDEVQWTYEAVKVYQQPYTVTVTNPDGTKTKQFLHSEAPQEPRPYGFGNALTGRSFEDRVLSSTNQLIRRTLTKYTSTGPLSGGYSGATRDLRPEKEITIVFEPGDSNALATMSETVYDDTTGNSDAAYFSSLNPKQTKTYHYVVVNASTAASANITTAAGWFSTATPATVTEVDYLYDANYKARNINGLVTETRVKDASGNVKAKSQIFYDEVGTYPLLADVSSTRWEDPNTNYRGLVTTTKSWSDIANNLHVTTHAQYDRLGNARKSWDGNGNLSQVEYSSTYDHAYPTKTISPDPDGAGAITPLETTVVYDYNTGLPTSTTDANNQTTQMEYVDPLLRPTKTISPNGHQTITEYGAGTSEATRFVKSRSQIDETNWKEAYSWFDGLGRAYKSQSVDSAGDVFTESLFDEFGRPWKSSNPYRTGETKLWTENFYDTAGRVWKVKTPDGAEVETAYGLATAGSTIGTSVTVTDQAGKLRRSVTNALGQLKRVDEPNASNQLGAIDNPNQWTGYTYDLLNNLITVNQGEQTRSFTYDNLSRLKSATNPESGTINYAYDSNGNLTSKVDARTITTAYTYDALSRVTQRAYTNEPSGSETPDVTYIYDDPLIANSKGKLTKVSSSISETKYSSFDILGRVLSSQQITDGQTYPSSYTYNLGGALIEQTYPSGRVVKNVLDNNGDLSIVQSKKSSNHGYWNYANSFTYNAAGAVTSLQLGNFRWESTTFNSRLQPTQIALGTVQNGTDKLDLDFSYGTTGNNGNVISQTITVPTVGVNNGFTATQSYTYDSLNRISQATENITGQTPPSWKQTFTYDRYGNRNFDQANTTQPISFADPDVTNPTISTSNNRFSSGQGYSYDSSGNTTQDALGRTFVYDAENKQIEVIENSVTIGEYFYDGDGKRIKKIVPNGETVVLVYDAAGKLVAEYANQISQTPKVSYLTTDHLGSPRINTDENGNVTARHDYHPFGEEIIGIGGMI